MKKKKKMNNNLYRTLATIRRGRLATATSGHDSHLTTAFTTCFRMSSANLESNETRAF